MTNPIRSITRHELSTFPAQTYATLHNQPVHRVVDQRHRVAPIRTAQSPRNFAWTDRRTRCARRKEGQYGIADNVGGAGHIGLRFTHPCPSSIVDIARFICHASKAKLMRYGEMGDDATRADLERRLAEAHATIARLRHREGERRLALEMVPAMLWWSDPSGLNVETSAWWQSYTGQDQADVQDFGWLAATHPDDAAEMRIELDRAYAAGEPLQKAMRIRAQAGGYRWHLVRLAPVRDENGAVTRWFGVATDIDEVHLTQDRQRVLLAELQHRMRNVLTVIRSVFARTVAAGGDLEDVADHFRGRLNTLARTQTVMNRSVGGEVDLEDMIRDELLSVGAGDNPVVNISGPEVSLLPKTAEIIGLAIHELTTNALKYGALHTPDATLDIRWQSNIDYGGQQYLDLTWLERGVGGLQMTPGRRGFGSELIIDALPYRLGAVTRIDFRTDGISCDIRVPLCDGAAATNPAAGGLL